jgi:hypothetical protein
MATPVQTPWSLYRNPRLLPVTILRDGAIVASVASPTWRAPQRATGGGCHATGRDRGARRRERRVLPGPRTEAVRAARRGRHLPRSPCPTPPRRGPCSHSSNDRGGPVNTQRRTTLRTKSILAIIVAAPWSTQPGLIVTPDASAASRPSRSINVAPGDEWSCLLGSDTTRCGDLSI